MTAEELAIWAIVSVALLLVAAMIWRGEAMPTIETRAEDIRPADPTVAGNEQAFDERAWLASNRYPAREPVKAVTENKDPDRPAMH